MPQIKNLEYPEYPEPEEILAEPLPEFGFDLLNCVTMWKKAFFDRQWKNTDRPEKIKAIKLLLRVMGMASCYPVRIMAGSKYCYHPRRKIIELDIRNPSILSSLHEFGHHLHGVSELEACRFSVHLFRLIFPKQYKKLEWRGHTLVKKGGKE